MPAGTLFSLTRDEAKGLFAASKNGELAQFLAELQGTPDARSSGGIRETGPLWNALHRCFTTPAGEPNSGAILAQCFVGGRELHRTENQVASFVRPDMVPLVAKALAEFTQDELKAAIGRIESGSDDGFESLSNLLDSTRDFYRRAAEQGNSVLFAVGY